MTKRKYDSVNILYFSRAFEVKNSFFSKVLNLDIQPLCSIQSICMTKICISVTPHGLDPLPRHKQSHLLGPPHPLERDVLYGRPFSTKALYCSYKIIIHKDIYVQYTFSIYIYIYIYMYICIYIYMYIYIYIDR